MTAEEIKKRAFAEIDAAKDDLVAFAGELLATPELGYREMKTAALVRREMERFGLAPDTVAYTGLTAKAGRGERSVCVMGELDALHHPSHVLANPETGNAHACGHHAQLVMLIGVVRALCGTDLLNELGGAVTFMATPAEETSELDYRKHLQEKGLIHYFNGKPEMYRLGAFDKVDAALSCHAFGAPAGTISMGEKWDGAISKRMRFLGRASHAGFAPEKGINALYAANGALNLINAQRETYPQEDYVRVHPIMTKAGVAINIVPDEVVLETYVRARKFSTIERVSEQVDRACVGAAYAMGAKVEIQNLSGHMPFDPCEAIEEICEENARLLCAEGAVHNYHGKVNCASTDAGDLSAVLPVIQPSFGGFSGNIHTADFVARDEYSSYVLPAKLICGTLIDLLANGGQKMKKIRSEFVPIYKTKEEFNSVWDKMLKNELDKIEKNDKI